MPILTGTGVTPAPPPPTGTGQGICQVLVGDVVLGIREAIVDMPPVLGPPSGFTVAAIADAGSTLPAGTYFVQITGRNSWGETLPQKPELSVVVGAAQGFQVSGTFPPGMTTIRAYFSAGGAGTENQFIESSSLPFTVDVGGTAGTPPTRSTAYNPDMDGKAFSAGTLFRWVNDLLARGSVIVGGFLDMAGVATAVGQDKYVTPGQWRKIDDIWYDGYPLAPDQQGNYFFRNPITASVLTSVTTSLYTDRMLLQVWPQAGRTAASTTLANAMLASDTQAVLASSVGILSTAGGFIQVDREIMSWQKISGNTLTGLVRGFGGSAAAPHAAGATATELNLWWKGYRIFCSSYIPGQSNSAIPVPEGWGSMLPFYGLGRARLAEQQFQEALLLLKKYDDELASWYRQNKVTTGPRQVGQNTYGLEVIPTIGGGWVVPAWIFPVLFVMHYSIDKKLTLLYLLVLGGAACLQSQTILSKIRSLTGRITSTLSAIRRRLGFTTSGCPRSQGSDSPTTNGILLSTTRRDARGYESCFHWGFTRVWKYSRSAIFTHGGTASVTG